MTDYFVEFYKRLDRQGPDDGKYTETAFRLLENLTSYPITTNVGWYLARIIVILGFIALAGNNPLNAQTNSLYSADRNILLQEENGQNSDSRQRLWAAETSLTFHIVRIYMLKFSYKYSDRVELGIGPAFQNWKNEDQSFIGQANAYTLLLSYRYYFWRKFNVEIELWPAWNRFESFIDNNTYKGLELWVEYKLGYRLDLGQRIYMNIQPGIGHPVWQQNKWPGVEEYKNYLELIRNETIFVPQLMLGFRF
jgi:hypothetical protein